MTRPAPPDPHQRPCGVTTAAARFDVSPRTMRRLAAAGEIGHLRVGGRIKFLPEHLDAYEHKVTVSAKASVSAAS